MSCPPTSNKSTWPAGSSPLPLYFLSPRNFTKGTYSSIYNTTGALDSSVEENHGDLFPFLLLSSFLSCSPAERINRKTNRFLLPGARNTNPAFCL